MTKLWDKGYILNSLIEDFTVGRDYVVDRRLIYYDCVASQAHTEMLGEIGILTKSEVQSLLRELDGIIRLNKNGQFVIEKEQEDCHTAIENHLTKKLGDLGKKIHTGRSRNDQIAAALRLYYKDKLTDCINETKKLIGIIKKFIQKYQEIQLPGYTHMRKAMPSSVSLWAGSFVESMNDNIKLLNLAYNLADCSPLGSGAGFGVPLNVDSNFVAHRLGFKRVFKNPLYIQNTRGKLEATILHSLGQVMFDLNKIASDLILFSMPEFGFFILPDEFCTGSSIMPQKKNPDVLELLRGQYHIITSYEYAVKQSTANLISGYNRDLQLTKEPTMEGLETTIKNLLVAQLLFTQLSVNKERCKEAMTEELYAAEAAYKLIQNGVPFRDAYTQVAKKIAKKLERKKHHNKK
jgi:argininosuccinate lyase